MWRYIFIAVNYNGSKFTIDYVDSVNNMSTDEASKIEIIIIDNNSDSADFNKLQVAFDGVENVRLYRSSENLGYFGGLNKGIEMIDGRDKDMFIVGNNDLTFDKNFINKLSRIKYSEKVLVIAPNIITKDGRQQNPHVIDRVRSIDKLKTRVYFSNYYVCQTLRYISQTIKKIFKRPIVLKNNYKQMIIRRGIGACYVLTPNYFKNFDKLDDRVFMWGEEAMLSHQIESVAGLTLYDPSIIVHHHESASVSSIQPKKKYYMLKNAYKVYKDYL